MTHRAVTALSCLLVALACGVYGQTDGPGTGAAGARTDGVAELTRPVLGFEGTWLPGRWVPLQATLTAQPLPFRGTVTITVTAAGGTIYEVSHQVHVTDRERTALEFVIPVPRGDFHVEAAVAGGGGDSGKTLWREQWMFDPISEATRVVLVVGRPGSLELLSRIRGTLADGAELIYTSPRKLPLDPLGYDTVDTVLLYNARLEDVPHAAAAALDIWVRRGGRVTTVGGVHFGPDDAIRLHSLLPGRFIGLARGMPAEWYELFPLGIAGPSSTVLYSRLQPSRAARQVPRSGIPILVYEDHGKGSLEFVGTNISTLGRIAMPGSGLWREAFPSLSVTGRIRFATLADRRMRTTVVGSAALIGGLRLFPPRATIALLGLAYVVGMALLTRALARGHHRPRAAVLTPAAGAAALGIVMLLTAPGGSWTRPAVLAEAELLRAAAPAHRNDPTPGVVDKDITVASRTGGRVDIGLPLGVQPVPLSGRAVATYGDATSRRLSPELERGEERHYFLQSSPTVPVTAEIHASSRGLRLSVRNNADRLLSEAFVLWRGTAFGLGDITAGGGFDEALTVAMTDTELDRRLSRGREAVLRSIRERTEEGAGPLLVGFFEEPLVPLLAPTAVERTLLSVGVFSLQLPPMPRSRMEG